MAADPWTAFLLAIEGKPVADVFDLDEIDGPVKFLEESPLAHPMNPEDRLPEGTIRATFVKRPRRRS